MSIQGFSFSLIQYPGFFVKKLYLTAVGVAFTFF